MHETCWGSDQRGTMPSQPNHSSLLPRIVRLIPRREVTKILSLVTERLGEATYNFISLWLLATILFYKNSAKARLFQSSNPIG